MKKLLFYFIVVIALVGGAYWYTTQSPQTYSNPAPALNPDLYPLYSGATWGAPEATTSPDYGAVVLVRSSTFPDTTNVASIATPFVQYYHDKLVAAGWQQDMMREAGGPGAEMSVYTKGNQFVVVSFKSVFKVKHPDAPSECPCDVQLTLESGTQTTPTPQEALDARTYRDPSLHFSVILPTAIASSTNDSLWSVDPTYEYQSQGPSKSIYGVKFTIPSSLAAGTNLADDSYISVEHLAKGSACSASPFMMMPSIKSQTVREGALTYSVASSTDAAVGNRYEETVYARTSSNPCIAVRYFIHYGAIENYPPGAVKEFDKAALLQTFDQIRRTLILSQ